MLARICEQFGAVLAEFIKIGQAGEHVAVQQYLYALVAVGLDGEADAHEQGDSEEEEHESAECTYRILADEFCKRGFTLQRTRSGHHAVDRAFRQKLQALVQDGIQAQICLARNAHPDIADVFVRRIHRQARVTRVFQQVGCGVDVRIGHVRFAVDEGVQAFCEVVVVVRLLVLVVGGHLA